MLYDQYGNKIDTAKLKQAEAVRVIPGVRDVSSSYPSNGLVPQRLARILRNADNGDITAYMELAEEMEEKEMQYASVLSTRKRAVAQQEITVKPADDSATALKHAEFVEEFLNRDCLSDEIFDIMDAVGKGFSVSEIIWDTSCGQWMPQRLELIDPKWFTFDRNDMRTILLKTEDGTRPLTPYKYLTAHIKAKSGIPVRCGLARLVAWFYLFKNFNMKSWVTFLEVYGQPIRIGKYGSSSTDKDKKTLLRAVYNIGSDAAVIIPDSMNIDFISETQRSSSTESYERFSNYVDLSISKAVLGQTTTTDAVSGGHAVSKEHNEVRHDIMWSDIKQLQSVLKRDIVRPMIDLNFGKQDKYPEIIIGNEESEDVSVTVSALEKLVPLGLKVSASEIRSKLGLQAPKDDDDVLTYAPQPLSPALNERALNEALNDGLNPVEPDDMELAAREMAADYESTLNGILSPVEQALEHCHTYDDARRALLASFPDMDTDKLESLLAKAFFRAHLNGRVGYGKD